MMVRHILPIFVLLFAYAFASPGLAQPSYLLFESGPVRPIALSPGGTRLFVANTPDNHLEVFDVDGAGALTPAGSVPVGLEPVAVAARTDDEVWVVNHLSDSVSIVDLSSGEPRVKRTLLVGDEPSDIVFAGPGGNRAFVSAAHRGQNAHSVTGNFDTQGIGRADVYVFDATNLGDSLEGDRLTVITLFGDRPRALATDASGSRVYAAIFRSGNRTTVLNTLHVCQTNGVDIQNEVVTGPCTVGIGSNAVTAPGGKPTPHKNHQGIAAPDAGLILKQDRDGGTSGQWQDELGRDWSALVKFDLPDQDVFSIDANANPPVPTGTPFTGVGTTLFNMAVHPTSGKIFVSNTESQNHVRFEGPGDHVTQNALKPAGEPATVRGNLAQSRITVLDANTGNVSPRHLNKHIPYGTVPVPAGVAARSLATPLGIDFSDDGDTLYVAGFGSGKIGVYDRAQLEADSFVPNAAAHIALSGGGPSGLLVSGSVMYVTTRFDHELKVLDLGTGAETQRFVLHNPEPAHIVAGRPFLYDALLTGSNGEASCASCHLFADMDDLAWDLGDPDEEQVANNNPSNPVLPVLFQVFHPQKGPMTTQSLRGLENMGPQHWRGDRQGDETVAFEAFNPAFPGLVGRDAGELTPPQMAAFRQFALELRYPPNPIRQLDNRLRPNEADGADHYNNDISDGVATCEQCHTIDAANGHFGGNGESTFDALNQDFKVPHLRNMYQKVGMFGFQDIGGSTDGPFSHQGNQVRGFGYSHDGSIDSIFRFTSASVFSSSPQEQSDTEAFLMVFPTDLAPIVGQQVTLSPGLVGGANATDLNGRLDLMIQRAGTGFTSAILGDSPNECEVVAKVVESAGTESRSYLRSAGGSFTPDDGGPAISEGTLRSLAITAGQEVTFTCVPPGSGHRMALDRDEDGLLNGLDNCPAAPNAGTTGTCTAGALALLGTQCGAAADCGAGGVCSRAQEDADADMIGDACDPTPVPEPGSLPTLLAGAGLLRLLGRRRAIA